MTFCVWWPFKHCYIFQPNLLGSNYYLAIQIFLFLCSSLNTCFRLENFVFVLSVSGNVTRCICMVLTSLEKTNMKVILIRVMVRVMVINATVNNMSVISWQSVLFVEETGVPGENNTPAGSHWQFYHIMLYISSTHRHRERDIAITLVLYRSMSTCNIHWLVFNANLSSIWAISWRKLSLT